MKKIVLVLLLLVATPFVTYSQTMRMTPDSGYQGQKISVWIVGIGTQFSSSNNASEILVKLEQSGNSVSQAYGYLDNDTTVSTILTLGTALLGNYDLEVDVINDDSEKTFKQASAFLVVKAPPSIASLNPASAYNSKTVSLTVTGLNTNFTNGELPMIYFQQNGFTYFNAQVDTVYSNTSLGVSVTIPNESTAANGVYDVIVQNEVYSDTGKQEFTLLGPAPPPPGVTFSPDSAAAGTDFDVTIIGQSTNFAPTGNASYPAPTMYIALKQNGVTAFQTTATSVSTASLAYTMFRLPDTLASGSYSAHCYYPGTSYDWSGTFSVTGGSTIGNQSGYSVAAKAGDTVTIGVSGTGVHFIYQGNQYVQTVRLVNGSVSILAQSVSVTNDTSLSAFFSIPSSAKTGIYDIQVIEPGTQRTDIGSSKFTIDAASGVTDINSYSQVANSIIVAPNPVHDNASISFTMSDPGHVRLLIYDALGRTVATLCDRNIRPGTQSFEWSSSNASAGSYFYELTAGDETHEGLIVVKH